MTFTDDPAWQVQWFGPEEERPALFAFNEQMRSVPVGCICLWCDEAIGPDDSGIWAVSTEIDGGVAHKPLHRECFLRQVVGSIAHQRGECSCHATGEPPCTPVGLPLDERMAQIFGRRWSKREEARIAVAFAEERHGAPDREPWASFPGAGRGFGGL